MMKASARDTSRLYGSADLFFIMYTDAMLYPLSAEELMGMVDVIRTDTCSLKDTLPDVFLAGISQVECWLPVFIIFHLVT